VSQSWRTESEVLQLQGDRQGTKDRFPEIRYRDLVFNGGARTHEGSVGAPRESPRRPRAPARWPTRLVGLGATVHEVDLDEDEDEDDGATRDDGALVDDEDEESTDEGEDAE